LCQGKHGEAEAVCRRAIELKPDLAEAHFNVGRALEGRARYGAAAAADLKTLQLKPSFPSTTYTFCIARMTPWPNAIDRGNALFREGKNAAAEAAYRKAVELRPIHAIAHYNLANTLSAQARYREAEEAYRKAIELRPDYAEDFNNLGNVLNE